MQTHDLYHEGEDNTKKHDFPDTSQSVVILGGGIAGLAAAAGLNKVGIPVILLERAPELRQAGNAIGMWPNSFKALDALGCGDAKFREQFSQNYGTRVFTKDNVELRYFSLEEALGKGRASENRPIGRAALLEKLAGASPSKCLFSNTTVESVEHTPTGALIKLKNGQELKAKVVVGCEGANSPTAKFLELPTPKYEGYIGIRGLAPLAACEACGAYRPNTFMFVLGQGNRFGLMPLNKEFCYWFLTVVAPEGKHVYDSQKVREEALEAVKDWIFPIKAVLEASPLDTLQRSRIFDRWMPAGKPFGKGSVTVMGDAAHVSTPNLGQGGCAAVEDAVEFTRILRLAVGGEVGTAGPAFKAASKETIDAALREYEIHRSKRTSLIVKKSWITGYIGQVTWTPLVWARNFFTARILSAEGMFDHAKYDPGTL